MYHAKTLGRFDADVRLFADAHGRVPEKGDLARDFSYVGVAASHRCPGENWRAFVVRAEEATADARAARAASNRPETDMNIFLRAWLGDMIIGYGLDADDLAAAVAAQGQGVTIDDCQVETVDAAAGIRANLAMGREADHGLRGAPIGAALAAVLTGVDRDRANLRRAAAEAAQWAQAQLGAARLRGLR